MAKGPGAHGLKLLLLEAAPGSLATVRDVWSDAEISVLADDQTAGVVDQVSREKIQMVVCDVKASDATGLLAIQSLRRVHPDLPLVAVLSEPSLPLALTAFHSGVNDVLSHPLDKETLLDAWNRIFARLEQDIQQTITQQAAKRSLDGLVLLKAIGETTHHAEDQQKLLDRVVDLIQSSLEVDIVSLMLLDGQGALSIQSARGVPDDVRNKVVIAPGEGVSGHVMQSGESVLIEDLRTDGRFLPRTESDRYHTGSLLSVPIRYQQQVLGVLNVNNKRNGEAFTGSDQELLQTIAHQTALAIENMKLVGRLQEKNREAERAHAELVKLHEGRTRFVCNLSHELKTPLTSVLGFADLLHNFYDQVDPACLQEYIARIYDKGKHLEHLLTGMLRLFSIDSGSEDWQWQDLSLRDSLARVLQKYEDEIDAQGLELKVHLPGDLMPVRADQDKLEILLDALVDNAIKFNCPGGLLSINTDNMMLHGNAMVYLQIFNQGSSVPQEHAEDIFQGYSQLGELAEDKPSGVGIGLATCRAILRQMHGEIYLEPNDDREGTSIGLLLPTRETEMELKHG